LNESAKAEPLSRASHTNCNANRPCECGGLFSRLEGSGDELGKSAKDRHPRVKCPHCREANDIGRRTFERTGWEKIGDADSEHPLSCRLFDGAKLKRDVTGYARVVNDRELDFAPGSLP
jgi:phage FluMu protein Com